MKKVIIDKDGFMANAQTGKRFDCPLSYCSEDSICRCGNCCAYFNVSGEAKPIIAPERLPQKYHNSRTVRCKGDYIAKIDEEKQKESDKNKEK